MRLDEVKITTIDTRSLTTRKPEEDCRFLTGKKSYSHYAVSLTCNNTRVFMKKIVFVATLCGLAAIAFYSVTYLKKTADAYLFAYPLALMEATRNNMVATEAHTSDENHLVQLRELPDHNFRAVVRPNNDTLYSITWFDLSQEPQIISAPEMGNNYYVLPFMDAWTNVFSTVGTRTSGNQSQTFALVGPDWKGDLPSPLQRIDSPTNMVWMIARIEIKNLDNLDEAFAQQDQFRLTGLADWHQDKWRDNRIGRRDSSSPTTALAPPDWVASLDAQEFFELTRQLMATQYPSDQDQAAIHNLRDIGINPEQAFEPNFLQRYLMDFALEKTRATLLDRANNRQPNENNWFVIRDGIGRYGQNYKARAFIAQFGLGALPPEEASYPNTAHDSSLQPLDGRYRYRIHWDREQLPPVNAFWSLTIYDDSGYMIDNSIGRYRIGSNNQLQWNTDGSLELQLQNKTPDSQNSNWLPIPEGRFNMVLRLYWPDQSFLQGQWQLPVIERLP